MKARIITANTIVKEIPQLSGKKVLVGGCFDILHIGHIRFLHAAKQRGDFLIVLLESDEFIQSRKKRRPLHTQKERAEILSSVRSVDMIILLPFLKDNQEYQRLVQKIRPDVIAVSDNDPQIHNKQRQAESIGGVVAVVLAYIPKKASTDLLKAIQKIQ